MFSAKDIKSMEFELDRRGYNTADVRAFLAQIGDQFDELTRQNQELLAQKAASDQDMLLLAEKIEEYKNNEDRLSAALLSTQKVCDALIRDAKRESADILNDAKEKAANIMYAANTNATNIRAAYEAQQREFTQLRDRTQQFKLDVLDIYKTHLDLLSLLDDAEPEIELQPIIDLTVPVEEVIEEGMNAATSAPQTETVLYEDITSGAIAPEDVVYENEIPEPEEIPVDAAGYDEMTAEVAGGTTEFNLQSDISTDGFASTMEIANLGGVANSIGGDTFKTIQVQTPAAYTAPVSNEPTGDFDIPVVENSAPTNGMNTINDIFADIDFSAFDEVAKEVEAESARDTAAYAGYERLDNILPADGKSLVEHMSGPEVARPVAAAEEPKTETASKRTRRRRFPTNNADGSRFGKLDFGSDFSFDL